MKCPYCSKEMESGVVQSTYPIYWQSNRRSWNWPAIRKRDKDIPIYANKSNSDGFYNGFFANAGICKTCNKVIIDF